MHRLVLAHLVACAALAGVGASSATADQGQAVVSATIYPASSGSVSTQSVTLGVLDGCPLYNGSSPMYLYPGNQPYSPAAPSSWAVSTVVQCALGQPLNAVTDVQLQSPAHGFETPLTNAQLSDPSQFHDPAAPDALPVISVDGTENQNTYVRPWLGGTDDNAADQVIADGGPITIVVYENGPPLTVNASQRTISRRSTSMTVQLQASVRNPDGTTVPASAVRWTWNFADGSSSSDPTPRHSFAPGVYPVTVQVTDQNAGTGGTATINVDFSPSSRSGSGNRPGAGRSGKSRAATGPVHSSGNHPGASGGASTGSATPTGAAHHSTAAAAAPAQPAKSAQHTSTPATASRPAARPPRQNNSSHPATRAVARTRVTTAPRTSPATGPAVVGQLISDVTPVPPSASPLARIIPAGVASAPAVRGAVHATDLPAVAGGVLALLLFGLGAARESRTSLRWRSLRARS
jgi:hypothetical protein